MAITAPRVNDKRVDEAGKREKFSSTILPADARRSPKVTDVLPVLYLRGLSTGDFGPALRDLLGDEASGLSATSISRLTSTGRTITPRSGSVSCVFTATPTCTSTGCI